MKSAQDVALLEEMGEPDGCIRDRTKEENKHVDLLIYRSWDEYYSVSQTCCDATSSWTRQPHLIDRSMENHANILGQP